MRHLGSTYVLAIGFLAWAGSDACAQLPSGNRPSSTRQPTADELRAAQRIYELLLELARINAKSYPRSTPAPVVYSERWSDKYEIEPVKRMVMPANGKPVPFAVRPPILLAYQMAVEAEQAEQVRDHLESREVVLIEKPLEVFVETRVRGIAYVRPTDGPYKGKFFVVDNRYVK